MSDQQAQELTIAVPESVGRMKHVLARLQRFPALSPIRVSPMVELPCCGMMVDFDGIDCSQDGPSRVFWPPRWTCLQCAQTFTLNHDESALDLLAAPVQDEGEACKACGSRLIASCTLPECPNPVTEARPAGAVR